MKRKALATTLACAAILVSITAHAQTSRPFPVALPAPPPTLGVAAAAPAAAAPAAGAPATGAPTPQPTPPSRPPRKRRGGILHRFQLGVRTGYSKFLNARTRDRFGEGGFSLRPTFTRIHPLQSRSTLHPNFDLTYSRHNDNRLFSVALGAEYRRILGAFNTKQPPPAQPYIGADVNLVPTSLRVPQDGIDSHLKLGASASLLAGYRYKARLQIEARYTAFTKIEGFDFSSVRISANLKF